MATSLQQELSAMVQEVQNLEKALTDLDTLVTQSTAKLHQMEAQTTGLITAAVNAVEHHSEDLHALGQAAQTTATQLKAEVEKIDAQVQTETQSVTSSAEKTFSTIDQLKAHAQTLHDAVATHTTDITNEMHQFDELIKGLETSLNSRITAATDAATQGTHELEELGAKWVAMSHQLGQSIGEALQHTSDEIDQKYVAPLDDAVKQFADVTKQIEDEVLSNPIQGLSDQLKNTILTESQHIIDSIVQEVEKVLEDAIHRLSEAGEGNDAVAKEMHAIFQELDPVWNALTDALRSVQSIWDTVKSAVSVL
jgi:uncharacterized coiled-coil DUF342 family protein